MSQLTPARAFPFSVHMLLVMHLKAEQETELLKDIEYRVKWMDLKKLVFLRYAQLLPSTARLKSTPALSSLKQTSRLLKKKKKLSKSYLILKSIMSACCSQ